MRKVVFFLSILCISIVGLALNTPTYADDFQGNKCYDDWDWCNDSTEFENAYWWEAGWCADAIEAEVIRGTVDECTGTPDDTVIVEEITSQATEKKKRSYCQINIGEAVTEDEEDFYLVFKNTKNVPDASPVDESASDPGKKECAWWDDLKEVIIGIDPEVPEDIGLE